MRPLTTEATTTGAAAGAEPRDGPVPAAEVPPLAIRHNPMEGAHALTLCCILHDERFFLPEFLRHYRRLGVTRFIMLDDRSTDGGFEFLARQPDVMLVGSALRYADQIAYGPRMQALVRETRAVRLWRDQMLDRFCDGQWAVVVDPDEFLALPEGDTLPGLAARLEETGVEAVWGCMIDMYPRAIGDILEAPAGAEFSLSEPWFFDARPHLRLRPGHETPRAVYPGSVARLLAQYRVMDQGGLDKRLRRRLTGYRYATHSMIHKTPLVRWRRGDHFLNCHLTDKPVGPRHLLPILHFKFTADLGRKIDFALESAAYNQGSRSYRLYAGLLAAMKARDGSFTDPVSRPFTGFEDLRRAGLALP